MLLGELQSKDVVNVVDGSKLGKISDVDVDVVNGKIISITIQQNTRFRNFLSNKDNNILIPWNQIIKIGGEVIIVNYSNYLK